MGVWILHDDDVRRAVLYDSIREQPISGVSFMGSGAEEEAESFLAYLATTHNRDRCTWAEDTVQLDDPRVYTPGDLAAAHERWLTFALNAHGRLTAYGWALQQWHVEQPTYGSAYGPPPEPHSVGVS